MRRKVALIVRIWKAVPLTPRVIISGLALLFWIWIVLLAGGLIQGLIKFFRYGRKPSQGRNMRDSFRAVSDIIRPLLNIAFAGVLVFIVLTIGEYFHEGMGLFGGGGVTLFWQYPGKRGLPRRSPARGPLLSYSRDDQRV
jgi:hypothetical protein